MSFTGTRRRFAGNAFFWILIGAACLGVVAGGVFSLRWWNAYVAENPSHVQRFALPEAISDADRIAMADAATDTAELVETPEDIDDGAQDESENPANDSTAPVQVAEVAEPAEVGGRPVMNVAFDLGGNDLSHGLHVTKRIILNGTVLGTAGLTIDQRSRLYVSSADLGKLLPDELFARVNTGATYMTFDDLRQGGLEVRYDPLEDVVQIAS